MVQDAIPPAIRTAYQAAVSAAAGDRPQLCAARLALLQALARAGVAVDARDLREFYRWAERQVEAGRVTG